MGADPNHPGFIEVGGKISTRLLKCFDVIDFLKASAPQGVAHDFFGREMGFFPSQEGILLGDLICPNP